MGNRTALRFVALIVIAAFGFVALPARVKSGGQDILDRIRDTACVVSVVEENSNIPGTRFFLLEFEQPVDHNIPVGPKFNQRVPTHHRTVNPPTVPRICSSSTPNR